MFGCVCSLAHFVLFHALTFAFTRKRHIHSLLRVCPAASHGDTVIPPSVSRNRSVIFATWLAVASTNYTTWSSSSSKTRIRWFSWAMVKTGAVLLPTLVLRLEEQEEE